MESTKLSNNTKYFTKLLEFRICKRIDNRKNSIVDRLSGYNRTNTKISPVEIMFFALNSYYRMNPREIAYFVCNDIKKQCAIAKLISKLNNASAKSKDVRSVLLDEAYV